MKVWGIGVWKTGTTSLGRSLELLGLNVRKHYWGEVTSEYEKPWDLESIDKLYSDHRNTIEQEAYRLDGGTDSPWFFFYRQLDQLFPESKFVLTTRDYNALADSDIKAHQKPHFKTGKVWVPPRSKIIARASAHDSLVRDYFRDKPGKLLNLNICEGEGWEKLCPFLSVPIPSVDFPWEHRNDT
jgi:hypothetical protein